MISDDDTMAPHVGQSSESESENDLESLSYATIRNVDVLKAAYDQDIYKCKSINDFKKVFSCVETHKESNHVLVPVILILYCSFYSLLCYRSLVLFGEKF